MIERPRAVRSGPTLVVGIGTAVLLAAVGLVASRPDIVAVGLPIAVWTALVLVRGKRPMAVAVTLIAEPVQDGMIETRIRVDGDAEAAELLIVQSERRTRRLIVPTGGRDAITRSRILHSGPTVAVKAAARGFAVDGGMLEAPGPVVESARNIAPTRQILDTLPVPRRLTGLHGAHQGRRPGHGGDFRDIHSFVPGDELRRVDWRATARMARRPGDLLVRRTDTLSEASVVIAMDTAEDLGAVVASWGSGDPERSGTTSLDRAREAARSVAAGAVAAGDRVALHVLVYGGRSVRSGSGARHLARVETAIAATGQAYEDARFRRTPQVPHGSVIYVLSTFFDGAAVETAMMWRAGGHRVVAVDILPDLDRSRLSRPQQISLRVVLAERENVFSDLRGAGIDVIAWADEASTPLRIVARTRR